MIGGKPKSDVAVDRPSAGPPPAGPSLAFALLPLLVFVGFTIMGADFAAITLRPLRALGVPYPAVMDYAHVIVPAACAALWRVTRRRWPMAGPVAAVVLCVVLVTQIPRYAESRVARIPVNAWIATSELDAFKARTGSTVVQIRLREGAFVLVAPSNELAAREELQRLGLLRLEGQESDGSSDGSSGVGAREQ